MATKPAKRIKIGKTVFTQVLLKVVSENADGTPVWLEIVRDDETVDIKDGSRRFFVVWGSDALLGAPVKKDG